MSTAATNGQPADPMVFKLNILDRLALLKLLPKQGTRREVAILESLTEKLTLQEHERERVNGKVGFSPTGDIVVMDDGDELQETVNVRLRSRALEIIRKVLKEERLPLYTTRLCDMFLLEKREQDESDEVELVEEGGAA